MKYHISIIFFKNRLWWNRIGYTDNLKDEILKLIYSGIFKFYGFNNLIIRPRYWSQWKKNPGYNNKSKIKLK